MRLVERTIIKKNDSFYEEINNLCFNSKNLYNKALFIIRQEFFKDNKRYLNYYDINRIFKKQNINEYLFFPRKVSQQILKILDKNFKSFFGLLKLKVEKNYEKPIKIPKYLKKDGKFVVVYTNQAISKKELKKGFIKLSGTNILIPTKQTKINQVRIVPKNGYFVVETIYEIKEKDLKTDNGKYCSIDLGLNNLATLTFNENLKPMILNGKPLKSINQFFNKKKAENLSKRRLEKLSLKRENKINDYLHKASRYIINLLVSKGINTLIIGYNKGWKQEINIGKRNNQNFVNIPFYKFLNMLRYKALLEGINFIETEESYTSKCSFIDNEEICKHGEYLGKRIFRGLFKTLKGKLLNANVNGSLNILRKVAKNFVYTEDLVEVCSTPFKINF